MALADLRPLSELDGPFALPVVGNLLQIRLEKLHQQLENWADRYGPFYRVRFGTHLVPVLTDATLLRSMLHERPHKYRRTQNLEAISAEMGLRGVFSSEGDDWRRQRRVVIAALNRARLEPFFPNLKILLTRLHRRWEKAAEQGAAVDACGDLMRFTVDVTVWLAFGNDFNTMETDGPVIQQNLDKVFPALHRRVNAPFHYWRYVRMPSDRVLDRALAEVKGQAAVLIAEARQRLADSPERRNEPSNFLEAIIAAGDLEEGGFSDEEIFANIGTLLLAGEDTTANSMAWMIDDFMRRPHDVARARDEVDECVAPDAFVGSIRQTQTLRFLDAFCNESMRKRPVAPLFVFEPMQDVEVRGYRVPKGKPIMVLSRRIANSEENFANASDFDPDRWLGKPADRDAAHNVQAFNPFGGGPRICPGRSLALLQIRCVIAMLLRNFEFEPAEPGQEVREKMAFTMMPRGLFLRLKPRQIPRP